MQKRLFIWRWTCLISGCLRSFLEVKPRSLIMKNTRFTHSATENSLLNQIGYTRISVLLTNIALIGFWVWTHFIFTSLLFVMFCLYISMSHCVNIVIDTRPSICRIQSILQPLSDVSCFRWLSWLNESMIHFWTQKIPLTCTEIFLFFTLTQLAFVYIITPEQLCFQFIKDTFNLLPSYLSRHYCYQCWVNWSFQASDWFSAGW